MCAHTCVYVKRVGVMSPLEGDAIWANFDIIAIQYILYYIICKILHMYILALKQSYDRYNYS